MADTTLFRLDQRLGTAQALGRQAEQWHLDHAEAMGVRDLEDLIADAIRAAEDTNQLTRSLYVRLGQNQVNEPFQVGKVLRALLGVVGMACRSLQDRAGVVEGRGYTVEGLPHLMDAAGRLETLAGWLAQVWPIGEELFDPAEMEEAQQEAEAGNLLTHEEAWRNLGQTP